MEFTAQQQYPPIQHQQQKRVVRLFKSKITSLVQAVEKSTAQRNPPAIDGPYLQAGPERMRAGVRASLSEPMPEPVKRLPPSVWCSGAFSKAPSNFELRRQKVMQAAAAAPRPAIPSRKVYWRSGTNRFKEIYEHIKAKGGEADIQQATRAPAPTAPVVHPQPLRYSCFRQTRERRVDALMAGREPASRPEKNVISQSPQANPVSKEALERFRVKWSRKGGEDKVESRAQKAEALEAAREPALRPEKNVIPKTKPISKEALERFRVKWSRKSEKEAEVKNDAVPASEYPTPAVAKSEAETYTEARDDTQYDREIQYEEPDRHLDKCAQVPNDNLMADVAIDIVEANIEAHIAEPAITETEIETEAQPDNTPPTTTSTSTLARLKSWAKASWTWLAQTVSRTLSF